MHVQGWREYAVAPATDCTRLDNSELPLPAAHLAHGWTAYAALTRGVQIRPGDTVFVTSAAGAIGSMAGQIARLLGAGRVIGSTGSRDKADRLISELGHDAAVVRGAGPIVDQLRAAAPDGIDVLLDNVGGEQLQAAVTTARENARFVIVGTLSGQLASHGAGRTPPVELDSVQLLLKKIVMRGYSADDDPDARAEWNRQFGIWLRSRSIVFPHVVLKGIEQAPEALQRVAQGRYFGTVLVAL
ncbi:MDR family NADP-dependent oxidoreductase [Variovorax sp. PAMC26660]|uniref:MDR family NADP-dependent oxidoreductase n=1 Tax=Variovorax sp. PAMC26660 TaxID=2762322 RepID=UPI0021C45D47|nr:NADP-dependent oxidoreductase [Variovorax sp. PAMC26660]